MNKTSIITTVGALLAVGLLTTVSTPHQVQAAYIANLDGVHVNSTFEVNGEVPSLPGYGWYDFYNTARIFDPFPYTNNGAMIGSSTTGPYGNYTVAYLTGVPPQPNTTYTLTFDMGYFSSLSGGDSGYQFQLGTWDGSTFTGFGTPVSGTVPFGSGAGIGNYHYSATGVQQVYTTGAVVPSDQLVVGWSQTSSLGAGTSDWFGFDNVRLDAVAVPEPATLTLMLLGIAATARLLRRRK